MTTNKNILWVSGGIVALGVALLSVPSRSAARQEQDDASPTNRVQQLPRVQELKRIQIDRDRISQDVAAALAQAGDALAQAQELRDPETQVTVFDGGEGPSWLGVETHEVTTENAKELKLPAERGVVVAGVTKDSPAAKAGLKENDVIIEVNGQRVEGAAQFRRMIHEIPAGRSAQFTVWRDGRAQTIGVTLGKSEDRGNTWFKTAPRAFSFQLPRVEIPEMPDMPDMDWSRGGVLAGARPRLGIDAEDLSGQFGAYFGAPDGEGVLVRAVNAGSPAEKAGVKSGDVITSLNGERIRSLGDLREKLAGKREEKTAKLGVLRNKSEVSITVELPAPPSKTPRAVSRRTNI